MTPDLETPIANGRTAEIFAWDDQHVLKLYLPRFPADEAEHEASIIQAVHQAGVSTPAVTDVVTINGRHGLIMERIEGESMLTHLQADLSQAESFAKQLAQLHATIHQHSSTTLVTAHEWIERRIQHAQPLSDDVKTAVLTHLQTLPHQNNICHGDFHMDNIIRTANGLIVIDWCNAYRGHPLADVARTTLMLTKGALPPELSPNERTHIQALRNQFNKTYLDTYFTLQPFSPEDLTPWHLPIAAARLAEVIPEETEEIIALVERELT